jgi:hypothetical protein
MEKILNISEPAPQLQLMVAEIVNEHCSYIITEAGQPKAVIIEYAEYLKLQQAQPRLAEAGSEYIVESSKPQAETKGEILPSTWSKADMEWFHEHYLELHEKFAGRWVAVRDGKTVAWYSNAEKKWIILDQALAVAPEKCYHEFVFR